jgi:hypothetical protein
MGVDTDGSAAAAATNDAAENGFTTVTVNAPPLSGPFTGKNGYIEVIVQMTEQRYFSSIMGSDTITVRARAVAQGVWAAPKVGILVLDPTASGSLGLNGGANMTVTGTPTIVDSNSPTAAIAVGGGTATSSPFDITGVPGISGSGNFVGTINSGVPPTPDPLAYLPNPDPSTMVLESKSPYHLSGSKTDTLYPGVYTGGITVTGGASLTMMPGIYYMDGGGFSFSGLGNLYAAGVMIVSNPRLNSDNISINGNGTILLSPMTTGPYTGISLWQVRGATNTMYVSGNGGSSMTGTFYVPTGTLNVTGNGTNDVIGSQYISNQLNVNGNGTFTVAWNPNQIARTRILTLVE